MTVEKLFDKISISKETEGDFKKYGIKYPSKYYIRKIRKLINQYPDKFMVDFLAIGWYLIYVHKDILKNEIQ